MYQGSPTAPGRVSALRLARLAGRQWGAASLTAAGYTVVRFTWRRLRYDPQTVADRIKTILGRGSRRPGPGPPTTARGEPARA
jgi:hypothetical protein